MTRRTQWAARTARLTGLALAALLTAAPVAPTNPAAAQPGPAASRAGTAAGTITYIQQHNVWVAQPDGSGARKVTTDGTATSPWRSPTQSSAGQIVAGRGDLIYRMDQWGKVLTTIDPPDIESGGGSILGGAPTSIAVSPNGALIAYTYAKYYCSTLNICRSWPVTAFTSSQRLTDPSQYGVTYGDAPSWVTDARVALDEGTAFDNLYLFEPGRGRVGYYWFDDANIHTDDVVLHDLEVSLGTSYGIAVRGDLDQARISFYDLGQTGDFRTGIPSPPSTQICQTTTVNGIGSPTVSADGALAGWHEPDGVWTMPLGAAPCTIEPTLQIPGASSPSFSQATLQTTRPNYPPERFTVKAKPKLVGKALVGRKLKATAGVLQPRPTKVRFQWIRDNRAIKGATKAAYKVSKKDRRHRLSVRVTAIRKGYRATVVVSPPVLVKR